MGKVVKFAGRLLGAGPGFITGGTSNALASLPLSAAAFTQNPFFIAVAVGQDIYKTFIKKSSPSTPQGTPSVFRQSVSDSFIVYGKRRVAGLLTFFHPRKSGSDHFRYFVIAVAGHRCQGVTKWFLNDEEVTVDGSNKVTSGTYANSAWLWFQRGEASETANATFVSECGGKWTTAHKGNGIAAIYAKFKMSNAVVEAGMPNITAEIEGRDEIGDPRDDSEGYTNNATLVFYDWMAIPREEGGFGAYADEIPDAAYISAQANVCDEDVEGEPRYTLNAVIITGAAPSEVRDIMVVNCAGSFTYSGGKYLMRPGYWVPPSETLTESDLAGAIQVSPFLPSDQATNEVLGSYVDPEAGYQAAPFATQTADPAPSDVRQASLDLAFTTSKFQAERIARIMLNRAQAELTGKWPMNITGLKVQALDTVSLATSRYGLENYSFQVTHWGFASDFGVQLVLREENEAIYGEPSPVSPDVIPVIDTADVVVTTTDIQSIIRNSYPIGLEITTLNAAGVGSITIGAHERDYPGDAAPVPIAETTIGSLTPGVTYFPYYDDETLADNAPTFAVTTSLADALNSAEHPYRHYLNQLATIPASPGSGSGAGAGGGYGGGDLIP